MTNAETNPNPQQTISTPYDWIKSIPKEIVELESMPRMGYPPPFPWEEFIANLSKAFEIEGLKITAQTPQWRLHNELYFSLGEPLQLVTGTIASFAGYWSWALSEKDLSTLMAILLTKQPKNASFINKEFQEGFYRYVVLEAINALGSTEFDKVLTPQIAGSNRLEGSAFCWDIAIEIGETRIHGRLLLSQELHSALKEHYGQRTVNMPLSPALAEKLEAIVHLEVGRTKINREEWKNIGVGDFILLDKCTADPEGEKSRLLMTLNGRPLFRGRVKEGNIKILETPHTFDHEEEMAKHFEGEDPDLEDTDEESSEFDAFKGDHFENHFSDVQTDEEEGEVSEEGEDKEEQHLDTGDTAEPGIKQLSEEVGENALENLPITIVVEAGRLQMSLQKLMDLQPGNVLELDVHPEKGVDLVINNRVVGKAELIRMGDALGVRVLDLGD